MFLDRNIFLRTSGSRDRPAVTGVLAAILAGVTVILGAVGPGLAQSDAALVLVAIPQPSLADVDPAVREQIAEIRAIVDGLIETGASGPGAAQAFGRLGQLYFLYSILDAAEATLRNAVLLHPEHFPWVYYLGVVQQQSAQPAAALASLTRALELEPAHLPTLVRLGQVEMELENLEVAEGWFEQATEHESTRAAGYQGLGQVAARHKDYAAAVENFEKALELQPEASELHYPLGTAYRQLGNRDLAKEHFEQRGDDPVLVFDPFLASIHELATGAGHFLSQGTTAFTAGDLEVAVYAYRKAVEVDPENLTARQALASALAQSGDLEGAVRELETVLEQNPEDEFAYYNLATIRVTQGMIAQAIPSFEKAIEINPEYTDAHFNLATTLEQLGRLDEAESHYAAALATNPQDPDIRLLRARVLMRSGRLPDAVAELETLLELDPGNVRARFTLAEIEERSGNGARALELFQSILEIESSPIESGLTHLRIAGLLEDRGDNEQALEHLRSATELLPNRPDTFLALARLAGRTGRFDEAAQAFAQVLATDPTQQEALFGRTIALLLAERSEDAKSHLEAALARQPRSVPMRHALARLLATSPKPEVRDGRRAVEMAMEVFQEQQSLEYAETVAMAFAEAGGFEQAVQWQERLIEETRKAGQAQMVPLLEKRLALYREGKPCRSPWLEQG